MDFSLDSVFQQIAASEEESKRQSTQLDEVRKENASVLTDLQKACTELLSYSGNLDIEIRRLADVSIRNNCLTGKLSILEKQREQLMMQGEKLCSDLASAVAENCRKRENFEREINEFCASYDIYGEGRKQREIRAKDEIKKLENEINALNREVTDLAGEFNLSAGSNGVSSKQHQIQELKALCNNETTMIEKLQEEKETFTRLPFADPDYIRLASELEAIRDCSLLEARCKELQHQLQQLHQSGCRL